MTRLNPRFAGLAGAASAVGLFGAVWRWGPAVGLGLLILTIVGAVSLLNARATLIGLVAIVALAETEPEGGVVDTSRLYESITAVVTPVALMFAVCVAAVLIFTAGQGVGFRSPRPFTLPLLLYAVALCVGSITGHFGGSSVASTAGGLVLLAPLLLLPLLIITVAQAPGDGRRMARIGLGLGAALAVLGLVAFYTVGVFDPALGDRATSYEPTSNWLIMLVILGLIGGLLARVRIPARLLALLPLTIAALTLSYRRSFWIAALLGVAVVGIVASGRVGRRLIVPGVAVLLVAVYLTLSAGFVSDLEGPVAQRVQSLNPSKVAANSEDRYRIGERRNVLAEIRDHPLTGIGTGVEWRGRYAVTIENSNGRDYVHMGLLWNWLKLGLLGAIAYLWLFGAALVCGLRVFRSHPDPLVSLAGLAVGVGSAGLAVAELTAAWVGPEPRLTLVFGAALGFLAVARAEAVDHEVMPVRSAIEPALEEPVAAPA